MPLAFEPMLLFSTPAVCLVKTLDFEDIHIPCEFLADPRSAQVFDGASSAEVRTEGDIFCARSICCDRKHINPRRRLR